MSAETRTYHGETGTQAFEGFIGLRYTRVKQVYGRVLVSALDAPVWTGVLVSGEEWAKWFGKQEKK